MFKKIVCLSLSCLVFLSGCNGTDNTRDKPADTTDVIFFETEVQETSNFEITYEDVQKA